jgi:ribonuclease E
VDVATFLLNEKRVDLQLIEARHRVSVMLIPNVRLETPNYTVTRMRHDDLNKTEPLPASYNLVAAPEEEQKSEAKPAEAAAPRQEAIVKGITPQQPAPVPVAREARPEQPQQPAAPQRAGEPSFISRFFGLFKSKPAAAGAAETTSTASRPAPQDRGQRRGWQGKDQRDGGRRDRGGERQGHHGGQRRPDSGEQQRHGGRPRSDQERHERHRNEPRRQEQGQRQQHQHQRGPAPAEGGRPAPAQNQHQPQGREQGEQREGRGRRRRRGGRDRDRDRNEQRQPDGQTGGARGQQASRRGLPRRNQATRRLRRRSLPLRPASRRAANPPAIRTLHMRANACASSSRLPRW